MGAIKSHEDLVVWNKAMQLAELVYRETAAFPASEQFGLTNQVRRAAVSVPSNIAEGAGRNTSRELFQFLGVATASLAELRTQIELARRLGFLRADTRLESDAEVVSKLLTTLRKSIRSRLIPARGA
jgi:four helix bundle protein